MHELMDFKVRIIYRCYSYYAGKIHNQ